MSEYAVKKPAYDLTVRDFFVNFKADTQKKLEALQLKMPVVKSIRVQPGENTKEIYASGVIYDTTTLLSDIKVGLNVVDGQPLVDGSHAGRETGAGLWHLFLQRERYGGDCPAFGFYRPEYLHLF